MSWVSEVSRRNGRRMTDGQLHVQRMIEKAKMDRKKNIANNLALAMVRRSVFSMLEGSPESENIKNQLKMKVFSVHRTPYHALVKALEYIEIHGVDIEYTSISKIRTEVMNQIKPLTDPNNFQIAQW